jgi:cytochrome c peroxidase
MTLRHVIPGAAILLTGAWLWVLHSAPAAQAAPTLPSVEAGPREELGRLLFWDPILSGHQDVACATCHHPDFAYADGRALSLGAGAVGLGPARVQRLPGIPVVRRNSPTILNTVFNGVDERRGRRGVRLTDVDPGRAPMFWDNRVTGLEAQALEPLKSLEEMRGTAYSEAEALDVVVARLNAVPAYVQQFREAFGTGGPITATQIGQAIAAFERTLVAMNSPYDRYLAGESTALTAQQRRGLELFDEVGCDRCHEGPMFSDYDLRAEGVREHPDLAEADAGDGRFRFRTPSLRNVALTAPYMHNGVLETLEDVLRFYDRGRSENPNVEDRRGDRRRAQDDRAAGPRVDRRFQRLDDMSEQEQGDIVAFMRALTDERFDRTIPRSVPSGLPPGGVIRPHRNR